MFLIADFFYACERSLHTAYADVYVNFFYFLNEKYNKTPTYNTNQS
jgi:hypothetical protein